MPSLFSLFFPFLIGVGSIAIIGVVLASGMLIVEVRRMQHERQQHLPSVWYQRPQMRKGLEGMGYSLALFVLASTMAAGFAYHFSFLVMDTVIASIAIGAISVFLVVEVRKMQRERREGSPALWRQRPTFLKHLGQMLVCLAALLTLGGIAYEQAQGFPDRFFPWNLLVFCLVVLIGLLGVALSSYANNLQRHSHSGR